MLSCSHFLSFSRGFKSDLARAGGFCPRHFVYSIVPSPCQAERVRGAWNSAKSLLSDVSSCRMSRLQHHHHDDIEAAGAVAIPIPPTSRGASGLDPFHRRAGAFSANNNSNKQLQHDAASGTDKNSTSSSVTDPELSSIHGSSAEIPRGNPVSGNLLRSSPIAHSTSLTLKQQAHADPPKLLHPFLLKIPLHIRFGLNGLLTNVMVSVCIRESRIGLPFSSHFTSCALLFGSVHGGV